MSEDEIVLNIAGVIPCSYANGPGKRFSIWVQGCTLNCKGCFNKSLQPHVPKNLVNPLEFSEKVISICENESCEGVSISGGEPFQQSKALSVFCEKIKKGGLTVICYTGYPHSILLNSTEESVRRFIESIDVLITGPFNFDDDRKCVWVDNTDKKFLFLTKAYSMTDFQKIAFVEYVIDNNQFSYSGFPEDDSIKKILKDI